MVKQCTKCLKISRGKAEIEKNHARRYDRPGYRSGCRRCQNLFYARPYAKNGLIKIRPVVRRLVNQGFEVLVIAQEAKISIPLAERLVNEIKGLR
jgi:hypothetical protein